MVLENSSLWDQVWKIDSKSPYYPKMQDSRGNNRSILKKRGVALDSVVTAEIAGIKPAPFRVLARETTPSKSILKRVISEHIHDKEHDSFLKMHLVRQREDHIHQPQTGRTRPCKSILKNARYGGHGSPAPPDPNQQSFSMRRLRCVDEQDRQVLLTGREQVEIVSSSSLRSVKCVDEHSRHFEPSCDQIKALSPQKIKNIDEQDYAIEIEHAKSQNSAGMISDDAHSHASSKNTAGQTQESAKKPWYVCSND